MHIRSRRPLPARVGEPGALMSVSALRALTDTVPQSRRSLACFFWHFFQHGCQESQGRSESARGGAGATTGSTAPASRHSQPAQAEREPQLDQPPRPPATPSPQRRSGSHTGINRPALPLPPFVLRCGWVGNRSGWGGSDQKCQTTTARRNERLTATS